MRLLILLLVAIGAAVSSQVKINGTTAISDPQAVSVAYQQILAISKAACKEDKSRFIKLVSKTNGIPDLSETMIKNWSSMDIIYVQYATYDGDKTIVSSVEFTFNNKSITGRFVFEKKKIDWILTDFPPILLLSTPTKGALHDEK